MNKQIRKSLALALCLVMMVASVPLGGLVGIDFGGAFEVAAAEVVDTGTCGDALTWTLDENYVLTISGEGDMTSNPWSSYSSSITSVVIESGVTSIYEWAFTGCLNLTSVEISEGVLSIGEKAFAGCSDLISVNIPASVTEIENFAFDVCSSLISINVAEENEYYSSLDGILFNIDKTEIVLYPNGKTDESYTVPDSVTSIASFAFSHCRNLTSVTIQEGVTIIGELGFISCTNLTSITIPDSVEIIENNAFYECTNLTSITISDSVTSIGDYVFSYCTSLETVYFHGTEADWEDIIIGCDNENLTDAEFVFSDHFFGEWIETIPATCIDDGEQIRYCECCGETETIAAKGVCVDEDKDGKCDTCGEEVSSDDCDCACHSSGFDKFWFDFLTFFRKIFGMTQYKYCDCGVSHW